MSFDERALLIERELRVHAARRHPMWTDGPGWWIAPLALLAALGVLVLASLPRGGQTPAETSEPPRTFSSSRARSSRN